MLRELRQCRETSGDTLAVRLKKEALLRDGRLLERVRQWGEGRGVTVLGYTPWLSGEERGWKLYTAEFTLAGGFLPMLEVLAALEREGEAMRPVAARFRLHTDGLPSADSDSGFLPARSLPVGYVGGGVPL